MGSFIVNLCVTHPGWVTPRLPNITKIFLHALGDPINFPEKGMCDTEIYY